MEEKFEDAVTLINIAINQKQKKKFNLLGERNRV